jgi:hypothetical protein
VLFGFFFEVHMGRIGGEFRTLVEGVCAEILGRPIRLDIEQVEKAAQVRRVPRGGHLIETARAIGATPVGKDQ